MHGRRRGAESTGCSRKRSESIRRAPGRRRLIRGARRRATITRTTARSAAAALRWGRTSGSIKRRRWVSSHRTGSAYSICTATFGSGWKTAGMRATKVRRPMVARGRRATARGGCSAAVPGPTGRGAFARRAATGSSLRSGATTTAFVWRGPFSLMAPYLIRGSGGRAPRESKIK